MSLTKDRISAEYLNLLQRIYHTISNRGIMVSPSRLHSARTYIDGEIQKNLDIIKKEWGCHVYIGAKNNDKSKDSVNLNAYSGQRTPLLKLQALGYKIPKINKRNEETGEYESKESLAELALQRMLASNQFGVPGGDSVIKAILRIRELTTLRNRYVNARLYTTEGYSYYLSSYNVAGTTTGRRSSRKHIFGFGNNGQNLPSHGAEAAKFKRCLISRPGRIFLSVDQMQAEEWPVNALAENYEALQDLRDGVDRHKKLACAIFNISPDSKSEEEWANSSERYLGKKVRHARNYGMRGNTMSDQLAAEGHSFSPKSCQEILDRAAKIDPSVEEVFHKYVEQQLYNTRTLRTPFGFERQFFGLRAGNSSGNQKIFRDAYSFIPQSTVGHNTGFAVFDLESNGSGCNGGNIIQEGHDSIVQEPLDTVDELWSHIQRTIKAFDRTITFDNGISVDIPVEGKIGYDFNKTVTLKSSSGSKRLQDISYKDIQMAYAKLQELRSKARESKEEVKINEEEIEDESNNAKFELQP